MKWIRDLARRGRGESRKNLLGYIAKQLKVRKVYFDGMIDCSYGCEAYYRQVAP